MGKIEKTNELLPSHESSRRFVGLGHDRVIGDARARLDVTRRLWKAIGKSSFPAAAESDCSGL
jgi:hypothetical protein